MNIPLKRNVIDWSTVELALGFPINDNYKEFYETLGSVELDEFFYIVGLGDEYGLIEQSKNTLAAYEELKEFLDDGINIMTEWLPVGYTIDGAYIFCNDVSVMLTDGGFENVEIYDMSLLNFLLSIIENKITSDNLIEDINDIEHSVKILSKR